MKSVFTNILGSAFGFYAAFAVGQSIEVAMGSVRVDTALIFGLFGILAGYAITGSICKPSPENTSAQTTQ